MKQIFSFLCGIPKMILPILCLIPVGIVTGKKIYQYNEEGSVMMTRVFEMKTLLSSSETWDARAKWIDRKIPRFDSRNVAANYLLRNLGHEVADRGLRLTAHEIKQLDKFVALDDQSYDRATVGITIKGEEKDIVALILELQTPGKFTGVDQMSLELDTYGLICHLQVSQWFLGINRSIDLSQHHQAKVHDFGTGLVQGL